MFVSKNCWILYNLGGVFFCFAKKILAALLVCQQQFSDPAAVSPTALGGAAQLPGLDREQANAEGPRGLFLLNPIISVALSLPQSPSILKAESSWVRAERLHSGAGNAGIEGTQPWLLWTWALCFHTGKNICTPTSFFPSLSNGVYFYNHGLLQE